MVQCECPRPGQGHSPLGGVSFSHARKWKCYIWLVNKVELKLVEWIQSYPILMPLSNTSIIGIIYILGQLKGAFFLACRERGNAA